MPLDKVKMLQERKEARAARRKEKQKVADEWKEKVRRALVSCRAGYVVF